jgi:hypothetical protein
MSLAKRQAFSLIQKAYAKVNRKPVTTPSTLRLIVPLTANRTNFTFPILEGDSNLTHPNQILLNRADSFTATSVGIFVGGLEVDIATGNLIPAVALGNEVLVQDIGALSRVADINENSLFINGKLNIAVNNVQYLQNFDIYSMNKSSSFRNGSTALPQGFDAVTNGQFGDRDGFNELIPTLQFSGTSKIDIGINTPIPAYTGSANLFVEIIFRGFLSLGASNLNK